jgi:uncharacterized protein YijF (DUF1287 family)
VNVFASQAGIILEKLVHEDYRDEYQTTGARHRHNYWQLGRIDAKQSHYRAKRLTPGPRLIL